MELELDGLGSKETYTIINRSDVPDGEQIIHVGIKATTRWDYY
jgi:hypothetical protein